MFETLDGLLKIAVRIEAQHPLEPSVAALPMAASIAAQGPFQAARAAGSEQSISNPENPPRKPAGDTARASAAKRE